MYAFFCPLQLAAAMNCMFTVTPPPQGFCSHSQWLTRGLPKPVTSAEVCLVYQFSCNVLCISQIPYFVVYSYISLKLSTCIYKNINLYIFIYILNIFLFYILVLRQCFGMCNENHTNVGRMCNMLRWMFLCIHITPGHDLYQVAST